MVKKKKERKKREIKIKATFSGERVLAEESKQAKSFYDQSRFGNITKGGIQYSLVEALYLFEKGKMLVYDNKKKKLTSRQFILRARNVEPSFWIRYCVFKDLRNRGYIAKTALKFGADFRVYDRGIKPGEDHAKWIVYPVHEGDTLTWHEFSAKNRVAHSTRKRLLISVVDEENDCTYYEVKWTRP